MAKRFEFRLDPLLSLRKRREDEQRRIVAEGVRSIENGRDALAGLERGIDDSMDQARKSGRRDKLDIAVALQDQRWRSYLQSRVARQQQTIHSLESSLGDAREELVRRSTELKVVSELRERRLREHVAEQNRQERLEEDEAANTLYLRRSRATLGRTDTGQARTESMQWDR